MITAASTMPATVTVLPSGTQLPTNSSGVSGAGQTLNESDFLQLLTAQLEHQDPLDPLTGSEFASELAEFSTATGVQNLETSLGGQAAVGLVGHNVAVSGNSLALGQNGSTTATGSFNLAGAAKTVAVTITNAAGQPVANLSLGAMAAGNQSFSWNGAGSNGSTLPPGTYSFSVSAVGNTGAAVSATPYAMVPVTGVTLSGQNGPMLDLGGGLAPVPVSAVQQVF